jgi:hypothetical protein
MTVFTRRLATESTIVRGLRANGFTNPWFCRFFTSFCMFLLVASCNVYAETFFSTSSGGAEGGSGGAMPSSPVQTLPDVNVPANRAPDVQEQLGAGSIIGMPPARNISPPLQVSKSPASVTTLKPITVNANVDKNVTPCDHVQPTGGDPIVLSTGAKVESATDFSLPGEMGLAFTRYYNSDYFTGSAIRYGV